MVALSACSNDQQLQSVSVSVKRADGDLGGSVVWQADVIAEEGAEEVVLGANDPAVVRNPVGGEIPSDNTLLVDGSYPDTLADSVVVEPGNLGDGDVATPSGVVSRTDFDDDRRSCGEISYGFLWPVLWVLLALIVGGAIIAGVGARIDRRRFAAAEAEWAAEMARDEYDDDDLADVDRVRRAARPRRPPERG